MQSFLLAPDYSLQVFQNDLGSNSWWNRRINKRQYFGSNWSGRYVNLNNNLKKQVSSLIVYEDKNAKIRRLESEINAIKASHNTNMQYKREADDCNSKLNTSNQTINRQGSTIQSLEDRLNTAITDINSLQNELSEEQQAKLEAIRKLINESVSALQPEVEGESYKNTPQSMSDSLYSNTRISTTALSLLVIGCVFSLYVVRKN